MKIRCSVPVQICWSQIKQLNLLPAHRELIQRWCERLRCLQYSWTNVSAAEQSAVKNVFPGLLLEEAEVSHSLCTVHSMGTLDCQLNARKYLAPSKDLISAMFQHPTKRGCYNDIQATLGAPTNIEMRNYIKREWFLTFSQWSLYAR